jgi:hypothetical protein
MTASLPREARDAFDRFVTTEYTTVGDGRQPITWPVIPFYEDGAATIDVNTGIGYPKKADDAMRNPKVSLLFSDPTGSGLQRPAQVLVQGIAEVDEKNLERNAERYFRESGEKLPETKKMHPPKRLRSLLSWYYTRLYIYVRPERVLIWHDGDVSSEPEIQDAHLDEVRSGHAEEPAEDHGEPAPGPTAWDARVDELGRDYETAVVSWLAPDGFPLSVRIPISVDAATKAIHLEREPNGLPLAEGRACLTVHRHEPSFSWQSNFQVRGNLANEGGGWKLEPKRLVGGFEIPKSALGRSRAFFSRMVPYRRRAKKRISEAASR